MADNWEVKIVCAACKEVLGYGSEKDAVTMAYTHMSLCPASEHDYKQAVYDLRFRSIAARLEAEGVGADDDDPDEQ